MTKICYNFGDVKFFLGDCSARCRHASATINSVDWVSLINDLSDTSQCRSYPEEMWTISWRCHIISLAWATTFSHITIHNNIQYTMTLSVSYIQRVFTVAYNRFMSAVHCVSK